MWQPSTTEHRAKREPMPALARHMARISALHWLEPGHVGHVGQVLGALQATEQGGLGIGTPPEGRVHQGLVSGVVQCSRQGRDGDL